MVRKKETEVKDFKKQSNFTNVSPKTRDIISSKATDDTDESNQGVLKTLDKSLTIRDKKKLKANQDKKKIVVGQEKEKLKANQDKKKIVASQDKKKLKANQDKKKIVVGQEKEKLKASQDKKKVVASQDKKKLKANQDKKKIVASQNKKKLETSRNKNKLKANQKKKKIVASQDKKKLEINQDKKIVNSAPTNKKVRTSKSDSVKFKNNTSAKIKKQDLKQVRTEQNDLLKKKQDIAQKQVFRKKQYQEARKKFKKGSGKLSANANSTVLDRLVSFVKDLKPQNIIRGKAGLAIGGAGGMLIPILLTFAVLMTIFAGFAMGGSFKDDSGSGDAPVSGQALQVATQTYEHLVKEHKFTSEGASGAIAVAQRESMFNPQAVNPLGGVAGLFQWSGWGSTINGNRIHSEGSIKAMDLSTLTLANQFKLMDLELNGSYSKVKALGSKSKDPVQSAKDWSLYYEGVSLDDGQTNLEMISQLAKDWYAYFNGSGGGKDPSSILTPVLNQTVNGGQCYGMSAYYVQKLGGPIMMGSGHEYAQDIGTDYDWKSYGWSVIMYPKYEQIKAGDVINWTAGGALAPGIWGHTGVVKKVSGNGVIETFEQNGGRGEFVSEYTRTYSMSQIKSIVRPPNK
ncbi:phage tail tip lysozyme [Lactococcus lactis]|uniref:phage tail tip lysozyme n=1 Tax=Lactococcus lactis TaxID=1358 RepID=UPI001EF14E09|nr:phage tail tip lysozyme [Lactococcus lactis]